MASITRSALCTQDLGLELEKRNITKEAEAKKIIDAGLEQMPGVTSSATFLPSSELTPREVRVRAYVGPRYLPHLRSAAIWRSGRPVQDSPNHGRLLTHVYCQHYATPLRAASTTFIYFLIRQGIL